VKVLSRTFIRPAPGGPSIRCWIKDVLTPAPASFAFVFDRVLEPEVLSDALSQALVEYPIFAGTLRKAGKEVFLDCAAQGALFEVVRHDQPLERWMPDAFGPKAQPPVEKIGYGVRPGRCLLHVRVNQFPGDRTVIGVSAHHTAGDGQTMGNFLKAWSDLAAGRAVESPIIPVDREKYPLEHSADSAIPSELRLVSTGELMRNVAYLVQHSLGLQIVAFHFTDQELTSLYQAVQQRAGAKLSKNDALMAHIVSIIQEVQPRASGRELVICLNGRSRAGIAAGAAGNYVSVLPVHLSDGMEVEQLALRARSAVAAWSPNYHSLARFVAASGGPANSYRMAPTGLTGLRGSVFFSKMVGFGFYDIAFGGAQPSYVMPYASPLPWFTFTLESYRGQGVQCHIHVPRAAAKRLREPPWLARLHRYRDGGSQAATAGFSWLL
jgi:hypothetical protein